jgi:hypothetical protein
VGGLRPYADAQKPAALQALLHNNYYRALNLSAFSTGRKPREHGELGYLTWGNFGLVDGVMTWLLTRGAYRPGAGGRRSAAAGPHEPRSYSWTGVASPRIGSTIRHASSIVSWLAKRSCSAAQRRAQRGWLSNGAEMTVID